MTNRTPTRQTVVGVFDNRDAAQRAIEQLKTAGFRPEDIGILMKNQQGAKQVAQNTGTGSAAGHDAGTGAVWGGVLGGIGGLIVGVAALAIPGVGPVIAAGPLAAGLGTVLGTTAVGAAVGAGAGAIVGALVGMGVPENEAQVYQQRFNQGRILVTVNAGPARYDEAQQILRNAGAEKIDFRKEAAGTAQAATAPAATAQRTAATEQTTRRPARARP